MGAKMVKLHIDLVRINNAPNQLYYSVFLKNNHPAYFQDLLHHFYNLADFRYVAEYGTHEDIILKHMNNR